ncbi:MAG: C40 family peptidase [Clostridia bacterium]|jgi:cell wall-associated NlpC family hydrolase|nr:C40 family peptidase [Clostridia bacterium]
MLLSIADECESRGEWVYPVHYAWDCSGLWWYGANKSKLYGDRVVDSTAAGVYANYCTPVDKAELRAGDLVFYKSRSAGRITHMAVVGEKGVVYEAMSGYTGVVIGDSVNDRSAPYLPGTHKAGQMLKRSAWTHFGRPKVFA